MEEILIPWRRSNRSNKPVAKLRNVGKHCKNVNQERVVLVSYCCHVNDVAERHNISNTLDKEGLKRVATNYWSILWKSCHISKQWVAMLKPSRLGIVSYPGAIHGWATISLFFPFQRPVPWKSWDIVMMIRTRPIMSGHPAPRTVARKGWGKSLPGALTWECSYWFSLSECIYYSSHLSKNINSHYKIIWRRLYKLTNGLATCFPFSRFLWERSSPRGDTIGFLLACLPIGQRVPTPTKPLRFRGAKWNQTRNSFSPASRDKHVPGNQRGHGKPPCQLYK